MIAGLVTSILIGGVGAVLDFALTASPDEHGFDLQTVGVIMMAVAAVGVLLCLVAAISSGVSRHRTVVDDGQGHVVRREDSYI